MTEEKAQTKQDGGDVSARLAQLEEKLKRTEKLRKTQARLSLFGVLVILLLLSIFIYRIYAHFNNSYVKALQKPETRDKFIQDFVKGTNAEDIITTEAQQLADDLVGKVLPQLSTALVKECKVAKPELEKATVAMGGRLADYCETTVRDRLVAALAKGFQDLENELREVVPDLSLDDLEEQLQKAEKLFIEELCQAVEDRLHGGQPTIDGLKEAVAKLEKNTAYRPKTLEQAQGEFFEALVELLAYELKPELGRVAAKK